MIKKEILKIGYNLWYQQSFLVLIVFIGQIWVTWSCHWYRNDTKICEWVFFVIGWFCASVVITYSLCGVIRITGLDNKKCWFCSKDWPGRGFYHQYHP